jgi:hypothetical protein
MGFQDLFEQRKIVSTCNPGHVYNPIDDTWTKMKRGGSHVAAMIMSRGDLFGS